MKIENKEFAKKRKAAQRKRAKAAKTVKTICWIANPCLAIAAIVGLIVYGELRTKADYSAGLTEEGYIEGVTATDYVQPGDYNTLSVKKSELISDQMVQETIDEYLASKATLNESSTRITASGDKVSIDFVGKIDGETFDNGTSTGYVVTIGEGSMIDDFEEQLIGHQVGDNFTVQVTFPENYEQNQKLSGKDAEFEVTLKGIYEAPELTDDYVEKNLSEYASTAEEYRAYVEAQTYEENLLAFVQEQVVSDSKISELPQKYVKKLRHIYRAGYEKEYNYYNTLYYSYVGYYMWEDVYDYYGMTKSEFQEKLENAVKDSAEFYLVMQAIFEQEDMTISEEEVNAYILSSDYTESELESAIDEFGIGYWRQNTMADKVLRYLAEKVTIL